MQFIFHAGLDVLVLQPGALLLVREECGSVVFSHIPPLLSPSFSTRTSPVKCSLFCVGLDVFFFFFSDLLFSFFGYMSD